MTQQADLLVIGAGGHASVLLDELFTLGRPIRGILDTGIQVGTPMMGSSVIGDDRYLDSCPADGIELVNGIGMLPSRPRRIEFFHEMTERGFQFASVVSNNATLSPSVTLQAGAQVMAGVVLQPNVMIRENVVVNTGSSIDHDCTLESNVWISPGVTICGGVQIGRDSYISAGAVILQNANIKPGSVVRAGAVVKPSDPSCCFD